ncbi:MAG: hypothetical protein COA50_10330 [Flavobacteriaceae bacterium]|nr:MAG: hypothetical protein COA50_10330 [Flavobacteriaceae bacterium]
MKVVLKYLITFVLPGITFGQVVEKKTTWFKDNVSIRKTFDGSKNENKPATFSLYENHKSDNDYINADVAIKIKEWELFEDSGTVLTLFPVAEYHRSTNENDKKDKLSAGLNTEFYFGSKWNLKPYLLSNVAFKRNFMEGINEIKYVGQISLFGTKPGQPGYKWRFDNDGADYRGTYYPYLGYEYNEIPDLVTEGTTEIMSAIFFRVFLEHWFSPKSVQVTIDGIYRNLISTNAIKNDLPLINIALNYYPGNQSHISIGLDYKNGYDPDSKFTHVEITSLNLKFNF